MSDARFPTTHWTQIFAAAEAESERGQAALQALLVRYQAALEAHLLLKYRIPEDQARDCLQSFIAERILKKSLLQKADAARGRFRTFLLTALDRFYLNAFRDAHAGKRRPSGGLISLEEMSGQHHPGSIGEENPEPFEVAWALRIMEEALVQMKEQCRSSGRADLWEVFAGRVLDPLLHQKEPVSYDFLAGKFGCQSPDQVSNLLVTAKRSFLRALRSVISEYARTPEEIEEEIAHFKSVLSSASAWTGV